MSKCPRCTKTVYFAERKVWEGKDWHNLCYAEEMKSRIAAAPKVFALHEEVHCNPDGKVDVMLSSNSAFCSSCGTARKPDAKFCASCGKSLA